MSTKLERTATGWRLRTQGTPHGLAILESATTVTGRWSEFVRLPLDGSGAAALAVTGNDLEPIRFFRATSE